MRRLAATLTALERALAQPPPPPRAALGADAAAAAGTAAAGHATPPSSASSATALASSSWESWGARRGLDGWAAASEDRGEAWRVGSKVLTYPLTVAMAVEALLQGEAARGHGASPAWGSKPGRARTLHVVGARGEASLPWVFWGELGRHFPHLAWELVFVGPAVGANKTLAGPAPVDNVALSMRQGLYESVAGALPTPDLIVCFHPGFARLPEWKPALDAMLRSGVPMLGTGFNRADWEADVAFLDRRLKQGGGGGRSGGVLARGENPFRSRWEEPMPRVKGEPEAPGSVAAPATYALNWYWWTL